MPPLTQTAFILLLYTLRGAAQCLPQSLATDEASCWLNNGQYIYKNTGPMTCDSVIGAVGGTVGDLSIVDFSSTPICCPTIPPSTGVCSGYRACSHVIEDRPAAIYGCADGDTYFTVPIGVNSAITCDKILQNYPGVTKDDLYAKYSWKFCCDRIFADTSYTGYPPYICVPPPTSPPTTPPTCGVSTTQVTTKDTPAASQCASGDTVTTLTSASTCNALTQDGSSIYVRTGTFACCDNIPAGTVICSTPSTTTTTSTPSNVDQYNDWNYVGCFTDSVAARTLPNPMPLTGGTAQLTVEVCLDACRDAGYKYAGLEYSQECYCGNTLPPQPAADGTCSMVCNGNPLQYCGGGNGLSVYQNTDATLPTTLQTYNDWTYSNCYIDSVANRVLPLQLQVPGGPAAMTAELCLDACHSAGYSFAGIEWSQECYCGSSLPTAPAADGSCDMKCNGNPLEYCGGGEAISVYSYTGTITKTGPSNLATYKDWTFGACYVDSVANRVLPVPMGVPGGGDVMTIELCLDTCSIAGYAYAGLEWSQECYCGSTAPTTLAVDGTCSMACKGNSQELCGGGDGISVYSSAAPATVLQSYNSWTISGCFEDSVTARSMPIVVDTIATTSMTVEKCLDACNALGHSYAGLEYAQECYCSDVLPATEVTDGRCSMVCKGNDREYCGGGDGLTVYKYTYTPVYFPRRS